MSRYLLLAAAVAACTLAACQAVSGTAVADDPEFVFGETFVLPGGQEMRNLQTGVSIRFSDVLEDSRCPTRVECFWTGQARIEFQVARSGRQTTTVEFNTNPAPGMNVQSVRVDDVSIDLTSLDPHPESPDDGLALTDYRATLLVRQG